MLLLLLSLPLNHTTLPPFAAAQRSTVVPQALTRNIPHSHCLVQTGRHHQVFGWVELGAHHVMIMSGQHTVDRRDTKKLFCKFHAEKTLPTAMASNKAPFNLKTMTTYQTQVLDCQFHMRIVWSSEALRIHGYS